MAEEILKANKPELKINQPVEARKYFENKLAFSLGPMEVEHFRHDGESDFNIIDVRATEDYDEGHVPGAVSLPEDQWESLKGLSRDKPNVVYCYSQTCHLAARASLYFASRGFPVMEMDGGFEDYREHNLAVERGKKIA